MPWSGSAGSKTFSRDNGTHTGATTWQQDEAATTGIVSDRHDTHDQDLADGINTALTKDGGNKPTANIDWGGYGITNLGFLGTATEASIASATTTEVLGSSALFNSVTGTTTITSLGTGTNRLKVVRFTGALTLTHNATSLILPGGANITTAAGDTMIVVSDASSNARVLAYQTAAGTPIAITAASDTVAGKVELATAAETTTGTDATRAVTPDGFAGSNYGKRVVSILVFNDSQNCATGNGAGDMFWRVPATLNGYNLVAVAASCQTAGSTGTMDIQIANVTQAADMLSTKITIDSAETDSSTAATPAVIDTGNDDVATGDQIRIDVDAVHTTPAKGLLVELTFQLP